MQSIFRRSITIILLLVCTLPSYSQEYKAVFTNQLLPDDSSYVSEDFYIWQWEELELTIFVTNDSATADSIKGWKLQAAFTDNQDSTGLIYPGNGDSTWATLLNEYNGPLNKKTFLNIADSTKVPKTANNIRFQIKSDSTKVSINVPRVTIYIRGIRKFGRRFDWEEYPENIPTSFSHFRDLDKMAKIAENRALTHLSRKRSTGLANPKRLREEK